MDKHKHYFDTPNIRTAIYPVDNTERPLLAECDCGEKVFIIKE